MQNIKTNTQDFFCIDDFFIINSKIYATTQLQTFRGERVSNMSYFNIIKRKCFKNLTVETTQRWQTLVIKDIRF